MEMKLKLETLANKKLMDNNTSTEAKLKAVKKELLEQIEKTNNVEKLLNQKEK